jgi:hypothetical protein
VWPPENQRLLEHQWAVAVDYWAGLAAEAQRRGVRVAVKMHANQLVYGVAGLLRRDLGVSQRAGQEPVDCSCTARKYSSQPTIRHLDHTWLAL